MMISCWNWMVIAMWYDLILGFLCLLEVVGVYLSA